MAINQYQAHAQLLEAALLLDLKQPVVLFQSTDTTPVAVLTVHAGPRENPSKSKNFIAQYPTSINVDFLCMQGLDFLREHYSGDASKMRYLEEPIRPSKSAWEQAAKQSERNYYTMMHCFTELYIRCYNNAREFERQQVELRRIKEEHDRKFQIELRELLAERERLIALYASKKRHGERLEASVAARRAQLGLPPLSYGFDKDGGGSGSDSSESEMQM